MTKLLIQLLIYIGLYLISQGSIAQRFYWAANDDSYLFTSSVRAIEVDSEDNVIAFGIIGNRYITESLDLHFDSSYNYFLAKFDPQGNTLWVEVIGSSGYLNTTDNQIGLALDSDDNIYVAAPIRVNASVNIQGQIVSYGGAGAGSETDVFIAKYDSEANLDFVFTQSADDSYPNALALDETGNIYLAGTYTGNLELDVTHTSNGGSDAYIVKYNPSGVPEWSYSRGNSINDDSFDLTITDSNIFWGTNIRTGSSPVQYHSTIEKFDAVGTTSWTYTISGADDGYILNSSAIHASESNVYITGDFRVSIDFPTSSAAFRLTTSPSNYQVYVSKLTDNGTTVSFNWAVERGLTSGSDFSFDITKAVGRLFLLKRSTVDIELERLSDIDGSFETSLSPDHPAGSYNYGYSLDIGSDNSIYIGGYHLGSLGFDSEIQTSRGLFLTKTSETLSGVEWLNGTLQHKKEIATSTHDRDGNMYVAGIMIGEYKDAQDLLIGEGGDEAYFQKYSPSGELLLTRMQTSFSSENVVKIKAQEDHLYIVGTFDADDGSSVLKFDDFNSLAGDEDEEVFLAKYSLEGDLVWAINAASTEGNIAVSDMDVDTNGNIYLQGEALGDSPKDFGGGFTFTSEEKGSFIAKYDTDGNTAWVNIIEEIRSGSIAVDKDQVFVSGTFTDDINFEGTPLVVDGTNDIYLGAYTSSGEFQWVKQMGGSFWEYSEGLRASEGSVYLSGHFYDNFSIESEDMIGENREGFIAKYSTEGNFQWVNGGGGPNRDYFYSLDLDTAGNPYVIGKYEGSANFGPYSFTGLGDRDIQALILGYDKSTGDEIFSAEYGHPTNYIEGDDDDYFNSISSDHSNNFYLTGDFIDEVLLDTILIQDDGNNTFFSTKMSLSDCAYFGDVDFEITGDFCAGSTISFIDISDLGSHEIVSWTWDFGDEIIDDSQHPNHIFTTGGVYDVTLFVEYYGGACELQVSKEIIINEAQSVDAGSDIEVCRDDQITLSGAMSGATTQVLWTSLGDGSFTDSTNPLTGYILGESDLNLGNVELVISSNSAGCSVARDTVVVSIREEMTVEAGIDQTVCQTDLIILNGMVSGTQSIEWTTSGDGSFENINVINTTYQPGIQDLNNQHVELTVSTIGNACDEVFDQLIIQIENLRSADNYQLELELGEVSQKVLTDNELDDGYIIEIVDEPTGGIATVDMGIISYKLEDPSLTTDSFTYRIESNCGQDLGQVDIINSLETVEVYNVVTPNGDGHHDYLKIQNIDSYPENTVRIFDRTGKVVFSTNRYNSENFFDGKSDGGKQLPEGNYYYRLQIPLLELDQSGFILLKR